MQTERDTNHKNDQQTQNKSVIQLVENVDIPADVDRQMAEVMEDMDE